MTTTGPSADELTIEDITPEETGPSFANLGLGADTLRAIDALGFTNPTPIQEKTIPLLLAGRNVVAQAPTGTGKTAAFGLPIIEKLDQALLAPQALIIAPTRELAIQVAEAIGAMGRTRGAVTLPIYGGQPYERQLRALSRGVQVVVGTPGRLLDLLERGALKLDAVKTVVLDEADEMLDMGFIEDIEALLGALPEERQGALFSATIPQRIAKLAEQYLTDPERVSIATREATAPKVRQVYFEVPGSGKIDALSAILDLEEPQSAIIFVRTRVAADEVSEKLIGMGYLAQAIHGEISQAQRERVLERFRAGRTQLLVATDVAARGLDIPEVSHIINYDLPMDAEAYVHRIGRTGRAGRSGEALTLVTPREVRQLRMIERAIHKRLHRLRLPTEADISNRRRAAFRDDILRILDAGQLDPFLALVEDLAGTHNPAEVAAAAFKMAAQAREATRTNTTPDVSWVNAAPATDLPPMELPREDERAAAPHGDVPMRRTRRERGQFGRQSGPMARLVLRVGRHHGVRPADIVGAISNEAGIPGDAIGDIDIYDVFSFVEIPEGMVDIVRGALSQATIRGQKPRARLAGAGEMPEIPADARPMPRRPRGDEVRDMARFSNSGLHKAGGAFKAGGGSAYKGSAGNGYKGGSSAFKGPRAGGRKSSRDRNGA
jgi:ATP-dependent RNA helicase DeaD